MIFYFKMYFPVKLTIYIPNKKHICSSSAKKCCHQQKNAINTTQALK